MQQPRRTAGPALSPLGAATALSLLVHACAVAMWLDAWGDAGRASVARRQGGIVVKLFAAAKHAPEALAAANEPKAAHAAAKNATRRTAKSTANAARARASATPAATWADAAAHAPGAALSAPPTPPASADSASTVAAASSSPAEPAPAPVPARTASRAGARFASLFAPIVSRPIGHGVWGQPAPRDVAPVAQAAMQREQAIAGLRHVVQASVDALATAVRTQPLLASCRVQVFLDQHDMVLDCDAEADQARLASVLGAALHAVSPSAVADARPDACLVSMRDSVSWAACASASAQQAATEGPLQH